MFVDFSKTFDSIPHCHLCYSLLNREMHGRIVNVLRNMYGKLKACVKVNNGGFSEEFTYSIGTRQGCMISLFLFIFYLNELIHLIEDNDCQGVYM